MSKIRFNNLALLQLQDLQNKLDSTKQL